PVIAQYLIYTSLNLTVPFHFITPQLIAEGCLVCSICSSFNHHKTFMVVGEFKETATNSLQ
ncbi:hypothetical protein, partial [Rickettsia sp. MEAM1 (Bemisia tabaci)]